MRWLLLSHNNPIHNRSRRPQHRHVAEVLQPRTTRAFNTRPKASLTCTPPSRPIVRPRRDGGLQTADRRKSAVDPLAALSRALVANLKSQNMAAAKAESRPVGGGQACAGRSQTVGRAGLKRVNMPQRHVLSSGSMNQLNGSPEKHQGHLRSLGRRL